MAEEVSPGVTTLLGSAGARPEIRHAGTVWKIGHPSQRAKSELELLAVAAAFAEVRELKAALPADAYAEAFQELVSSVAAKHYKTWGPGWQRVVWGPQSSHLFLLSLLREAHAQATEADAKALAAACPEEVTLALVQVVPNFVSLLLNDRPELTPEQRENLMGVVNAALAKLLPPPPQQPSTATTVA